jgi:hypothetical protein
MITTSKLKDYVDAGHDKRKLARWLINLNIAKHVPINLSDLSDTSVVAEEVDAIYDCLEEGDYDDAINMAEESAVQILQDEGFEV